MIQEELYCISCKTKYVVKWKEDDNDTYPDFCPMCGEPNYGEYEPPDEEEDSEI